MLELKAIPLKKDNILLDVEFNLTEQSLQKQKNSKPSGEIKTLLGKKNLISVGEPEVLNLVQLLEEKRSVIPADVKLMLDEYDFYQVRLACTFRPERDCKFVWSRFGMNFTVKNNDSHTETKNPVVHDIFPKEISKEIKIKRNFSIGPKFHYNFFELGATSESGQEYIRYEPEIVSFGLLQSCPSWDFTASKAKDFISGDKELFIILKTYKETGVEAKFVFGAEVHTFMGMFPMIPVQTYRKDSLLEGKFLLIK